MKVKVSVTCQQYSLFRLVIMIWVAVAEHTQFYNLAYKGGEDSVTLTKDLWAFRPRLSLEHLGQSFHAQEDPQKYKALLHFLKEVRQ